MDSTSIGASNANSPDNTRDPTLTAQGNTQAASTTTATTPGLALDLNATYTNPAAQRQVADAIATQTPIELSGPICYTMQPGQTVPDIATAFGVTVRDLTVANKDRKSVV